MSRLNKRAVYQMAISNSNSAVGPELGEYSTGSVQFTPVAGTQSIPDGRISGKLTTSPLTSVESQDGASVSSRARRNSNGTLEGHSRSQVLQKLGSGSLGLLTNAYLEQQLMYDEEIHTMQQRFYGLQAV